MNLSCYSGDKVPDNNSKKSIFTWGVFQHILLLRPMIQEDLPGRLEKELHDLLEMVRTRLSGQPLETLQLRPDNSGWNALECFAHLNVFLEMYLPRIEKAIHLTKARNWQPDNTTRYTRVAKKILKRADLNNGKAFKTPKRYDFYGQPLNHDPLKSFLINSERLLRNIQAVHAVSLNRAKIGWGPSGFFKLTLGNTLEWLVLHSQRHVMQAFRAARLASPAPHA